MEQRIEFSFRLAKQFFRISSSSSYICFTLLHISHFTYHKQTIKTNQCTYWVYWVNNFFRYLHLSRSSFLLHISIVQCQKNHTVFEFLSIAYSAITAILCQSNYTANDKNTFLFISSEQSIAIIFLIPTAWVDSFSMFWAANSKL